MSPRTLVLAVAGFALCSTSAHAQLQTGWQASVPNAVPRELRLDAGGDAWSLELGYTGVAYLNPVIRRYSVVGDPLWAAPLAALPSYDNVTAFSVDPAGQFATLAWRSSQGSGITRVDGAGNFMWTNTSWGLSNIVYAFTSPELPVDAAGNSYVLCATSGPPTSIDFVVISFAADGSFRWSRRIDGGSGIADIPSDITLDGAGGVYAVGMWNATSTDQMTGQMAITRVDSAGNVMWMRSFSGAGGGGRAFCVATDAAGNALVGGTSTSGTEAWVLKYDPAGTLLWSRFYSIGIAARYNDVVVDDAGAVYAAGQQNIGGSGQGDLVTDKHDANGTLQWRHIGNSGPNADEYVRRVHVDAAGRATVVAQRSAGNDQKAVVVRYERDGTPRIRLDLVQQPTTIVTGSGADANGRLVLTALSTQWPVGVGSSWTLELRDQSAPFCIGDGSAGACPCGNTSDVGAASGCLNSSGVGARLEDRGVASVSSDSVSLLLEGATPTGTCMFVQGATTISPLPFGDGQLCVSGQILRLYVKVASGGASQVPGLGDASVTQRAAFEGGPVAAGSTRGYQVFYRDADPMFCASPSGGVFNMSSGVKITWAP